MTASIPLAGLVSCLHPAKSGTDRHRRGAVCSWCFQDALVPIEAKAKPKEGLVVPLKKVLPGAVLEGAMLACLLEAGFKRDLDFICQYAWALEEGRKFAADFGFPAHRIILECIGQAHSIKERRADDCVRDSLAAARGWRVVKVNKAMVESGDALTFLRMALDYGRIA